MARYPANPNAKKRVRTVKTTADLQADIVRAQALIEKSKAKVEALALAAAAGQLDTVIGKISLTKMQSWCESASKPVIPTDPESGDDLFFKKFFDATQARFPQLSDVAIGATILKACGIKSVAVTKKPPVTRTRTKKPEVTAKE